MMTVFQLDRIQKKLPITKLEYQELKKQGLAEGRYPNIFVSYKVADITDQKKEYVKTAGISDEACMQVVEKYLSKFGTATKKELVDVLDGVLPGHLDEKQRGRKVGYIMTKMRNREIVVISGKGAGAKWSLKT